MCGKSSSPFTVKCQNLPRNPASVSANCTLQTFTCFTILVGLWWFLCRRDERSNAVELSLCWTLAAAWECAFPLQPITECEKVTGMFLNKHKSEKCFFFLYFCSSRQKNPSFFRSDVNTRAKGNASSVISPPVSLPLPCCWCRGQLCAVCTGRFSRCTALTHLYILTLLCVCCSGPLLPRWLLGPLRSREQSQETVWPPSVNYLFTAGARVTVGALGPAHLTCSRW